VTVALVQSSTSGATDAQTASRTVPVPTGAASGHVAVIELEIWLDTSTDPVINWAGIGFTQIAYVESTDGFTRLYVARKVLTSAETGTWNMTWTGNYWNQAQCTLWSGVDNTTPLDVAVNTAITAANTTMPAVSVTTVTAGCGMIHIVSNENSATGTAPTGYTEQQEANYLRTNTKVAGAAGAETPAGGSISVSTVKLGALVALRPAGGAGLGTALETDAGQPVGRIRTTTGGVAAETDTAQAIGRTRTTTAGTAAETEQAQAISSTRTTTAGIAAETDGAQPVGRIRITTVGTALEQDTAQATGGGGATPVSAALETDLALPIGRVRTTSLGAASETDAGQAAGHTRTTPVGTATETDTALAPLAGRTTPLGYAVEIDVAQAVQGPVPPSLPVHLTGRVLTRWHSEVRPNRYGTEVHA
jgi:hypothetical protein